jgi:hypothetical protein
VTKRDAADGSGSTGDFQVIPFIGKRKPRTANMIILPIAAVAQYLSSFVRLARPVVKRAECETMACPLGLEPELFWTRLSYIKDKFGSLSCGLQVRERRESNV